MQGQSETFPLFHRREDADLQDRGARRRSGTQRLGYRQAVRSTAETVDPCQVNFVKRDDFLRYLRENSEACLRVTEQLSEKYNNACREIRSMALSHSAAEKLARLLLNWCASDGEATKAEPCVRMTLTHEEIAQMIGTSRETVTRLFTDLKKRQILLSKARL